ncbi:unnamed protein product [Leuciscus chuanchicus]
MHLRSSSSSSVEIKLTSAFRAQDTKRQSMSERVREGGRSERGAERESTETASNFVTRTQPWTMQNSSSGARGFVYVSSSYDQTAGSPNFVHVLTDTSASIKVKPTPLSHNPPQMSGAIWEPARFKHLYFDLCVWVPVAKNQVFAWVKQITLYIIEGFQVTK